MTQVFTWLAVIEVTLIVAGVLIRSNKTTYNINNPRLRSIVAWLDKIGVTIVVFIGVYLLFLLGDYLL